MQPSAITDSCRRVMMADDLDDIALLRLAMSVVKIKPLALPRLDKIDIVQPAIMISGNQQDLARFA